MGGEGGVEKGGECDKPAVPYSTGWQNRTGGKEDSSKCPGIPQPWRMTTLQPQMVKSLRDSNRCQKYLCFLCSPRQGENSSSLCSKPWRRPWHKRTGFLLSAPLCGGLPAPQEDSVVPATWPQRAAPSFLRGESHGSWAHPYSTSHWEVCSFSSCHNSHSLVPSAPCLPLEDAAQLTLQEKIKPVAWGQNDELSISSFSSSADPFSLCVSVTSCVRDLKGCLCLSHVGRGL